MDSGKLIILLIAIIAVALIVYRYFMPKLKIAPSGAQVVSTSPPAVVHTGEVTVSSGKTERVNIKTVVDAVKKSVPKSEPIYGNLLWDEHHYLHPIYGVPFSFEKQAAEAQEKRFFSEQQKINELNESIEKQGIHSIFKPAWRGVIR